MVRSSVIIFATCAFYASAQPFNPTCGSTSLADSMAIGKWCFMLTNNERAKVGAPLLKWNDELHDSSYDHSRNMADGTTPFSHDGFSDRADAISFYPYSNTGENVAYNYNSNDPCGKAVD